MTGFSTWNRQGLPGSWGSLCGRAPLSDPGETRWSGQLRPSGAAFRSLERVGSRDCVVFRGSITRPAHSLSTLRRQGCPVTAQDSLPAGGLLCRAGFEPAELLREVSAVTSLPPHPGLAWRTQTHYKQELKSGEVREIKLHRPRRKHAARLGGLSPSPEAADIGGWGRRCRSRDPVSPTSFQTVRADFPHTAFLR